LDDGALVAGIRRNESDAYREFFTRFAPLLDFLAQLYRIPEGEREEAVMEFLDDAVLRLRMPTVPVPRSLASYLATSFKHRFRNRRRDDACRERLYLGQATEMGAEGERAVLDVCSEHTVRMTRGPAWEHAALSPVLERLALAMENQLGADERRMLAWLGQRVPQREIAEWLGVSHGAVRVRVSRLRERLRRAARAYTETLGDDERLELERYLRRSAALDEAGVTRALDHQRKRPSVEHTADADSRRERNDDA
jgi:RNA polymerase sigma factor (sigma-70 family)